MATKTLFALVDCNNFYASCERLFKPDLRNRPVVVLSNNDGCIIARSNEAKQLGIGMGDPYFKHKVFLRQHGVRVFSSNYALYGDLSHRVMSVLQQMEPEVEIYSIDEAFIRLTGIHGQKVTDHGLVIKERVDRCVGIPVSVGIGQTKTLAKLASSIAKKEPEYRGVFNFAQCNSQDKDKILAKIAVNAIWGIGRRYSKTLNQHSIYSALDLQKSDTRRIRKMLGLSGLRTVMELRGESCVSIEQSRPDRKSVVSSRSFRNPITSLDDLKEAVSCYVSIGSEKLRVQGLVAANLHVFLSTSRFSNQPYFSGSRMMPLAEPTSCTPTLIKSALQGLTEVFKPGYQYKKAGVMFTGLSSAAMRQQNLFFQSKQEENKPLMAALDQINNRWGRDTLSYGSSGISREWSMKQTKKSPAYTTSWTELPVVNASGAAGKKLRTGRAIPR